MRNTTVKIFALALCAAMLFSLAACTSSKRKETEEATMESITEMAADTKTAGNGKKVYLAGPLFNQAEKDFNLEITKVLEDCGYQVFLPQRDGIEAAQLEGTSEDEMIEMIFSLDEGKVKESDILFMNLDGRVPDEGACVELGIAYANGKRCYGFKTDTRSVELGLDLNPMISGCMTKVFKNYYGAGLIEELKQYLSENEL